MAEIVGVIGSSLAIFDSLQKLRRYVADVIHAPAERIDFNHRLDCVEVVVKAIDGCKLGAAPDAAWVNELSPKVANSPVSRLLATMEAMKAVLIVDPSDESIKAKLKNLNWHSDKKKLDIFLNQIKDHCISILIVLQWGEMEILKAIVFDTAELITTLSAIKILMDEDKQRRDPIDAVILTTARNLDEARSENQKADRQQLKRLESIEARLEAEDVLQRKKQDRAERKEVERWLSPLEFQQRQQVLFEKAANVQKGQIGRWFFECEEFVLWKQGEIQVLRGYGEPGAGKTILSSVVVDKLVKTAPEIPVLCVYLEKTEGLIQTAKNIRGSLLKQLVQFRESGLSEAIRRAFEKASRTSTAPNNAETMVLLKAEIESYSRVFIVVDGLDEANEESRRLIEVGLQKISSKLSILIMARKDDETNMSGMCCDICEKECTRYFQCKECTDRLNEPAGICFACKEKDMRCVDEKDSEHVLAVYAPKECEVLIQTPPDDIALFLKSSIEESFPEESATTDLVSRRRGINFMVWQCYCNRGLLNKIIQHIVDNADGRFLLAREYIKHFQSKTNMRAINEALENRKDAGTEKVFPFYTEDMDRIMNQNSDGVELARDVLSTMYFAKRNLTLVELLQALATRDGETSYDSTGESDESTILNVTKGLVAIERISSDDNEENDNDKIVRFEHLTRREYFDVYEYRKKYFPNGRVAIAKICLNFLSLDVFGEACESEEEFQNKEKQLPFVSYAVQFWGDHVREAGPGATEVVEAAVKYLKDPSRVEAFIEAAWTANTRHRDKWDVRRTIHPLHICGWFDLGFLMPSLNYEPKLVNVQEETHGQTPLMYACRRGNVEMVRRLLELGALVNKQSEKGRTALFEAVLRLKKDTELNSNSDVEKSLQIVKLLLDEKLRGQQLNINVCNPRHLEQTALIMSIEWQQVDIALAILKHPALNVNLQDLDGASALHLAACYGLVDIVQEILRVPSAVVDLIEKSDNRTPLTLGARDSCRVEVIEELLKHGANPRWKDKRGGTPLMRAVEAGNYQAFNMLAKSAKDKSDLNCVDEDGRGLWHWAAASGNVTIITSVKAMLPDQVNICDRAGMTPLHVSCEYGKSEAAKLLLEMGADSTIRDNLNRDPFETASQYGNSHLMDFCKPTALNGNAEPSSGTTSEIPIWSLALLWQLDTIRNRISSGSISLDVEPRTQRTALHCALLVDDKVTDREEIQVDILRELLVTGKFSPDDVDRNNQTPLHLSAMFGNLEATKLLLSYDANPDTVDRYGLTPLRIAFKNKFLAVGVLLIEAGATIEETKLDLDALLFSALTAQNITAVGRLIAAGANRMAQDEQGRTPEMVAKKDARLLAILKSTKSYRFKASTMKEKEEIGIELIENTIGDAEEMLANLRKETATNGDVFINGKSARSVRFLPFESRSLHLGNEKAPSETSFPKATPPVVLPRSPKDVGELLEGLSEKEKPTMIFRPKPGQEEIACN